MRKRTDGGRFHVLLVSPPQKWTGSLGTGSYEGARDRHGRPEIWVSCRVVVFPGLVEVQGCTVPVWLLASGFKFFQACSLVLHCAPCRTSLRLSVDASEFSAHWQLVSASWWLPVPQRPTGPPSAVRSPCSIVIHTHSIWRRGVGQNQLARSFYFNYFSSTAAIKFSNRIVSCFWGNTVSVSFDTRVPPATPGRRSRGYARLTTDVPPTDGLSRERRSTGARGRCR